MDCREVTTTGSTPGAEIVNIDQLEPLACITAFRHLHSTTVPQDTDFPIVPVINDSDARDPSIYPPGTAPFLPYEQGRGRWADQPLLSVPDARP